MPRIHQLPPNVVTKIAAGEVIERPASVVKELLENSIDAGSTRIDIDLDQGGTELIRVVDDGCGIVPEDLELAFAPHATSKLRNAADLFAIGTMGFRGEALASIGGVAKVTLQSRTHDQPCGAELRCEDGEFAPVRPWNGSPGTRMEVRHLFYNVPARKKFLKSVATELGHVCETVTRLALANPTLHLTLRHNGKLVYEIPSSASLTDRIGLFFGGEVRDALYELDSGPGTVHLTGYIGDPKCDRGNSKLQYLFVNGRWFRDRSVAHAMQEAFRGLLMTGRYAVGFLFLTLPPDKLDVNVHPTKSEVRFQENSLVYSLVRSTVKARLAKENLVPQLTVPDGTPDAIEPDPVPPPLFASPRQELVARTVAPWELPPRLEPLAASRDLPPSAPPLAALPDLPPRPTPPPYLLPRSPAPLPFSPPPPVEESAPPRVATTPEPPPAAEPEPPQAPLPFPLPSAGTALQVHDSYLVLETRDGMLVIDQHALHERILFEQLRRRIRDGKLEVQRLLIPEPIDLPAEQAALVLEAAEPLAELGLEVADFGGNTILLSSYPTLLGRKPPHEIFQGVVDHLLNRERAPSKEALLHLLMATMACKAAVKAGDKLSQEEIAYLLQLRAMAEDSHHCPHGRPTSLLFSRQELDKQFRRV
ncbi:MAG TPA: DNA mismatch repair endonuclease MutL [Gemmataceae bacterium]|nr:DNA mismatch repair endonuclease MutL [Gemmataceae bacterium]